MKTFLLPAFVVFAFSFACDDPDSPLATDSKFKFEGKEYALTQGHIGTSCATPTIDLQFYSIGVYLFGPETGFVGNCPGFYPSGRGKGIVIQLLSRSATEITPGVYPPLTNQTLDNIHFSSGSLYEYVKSPGATQGSFLDAGLNGTVTVSKSGDVYTIEFDFTRFQVAGGGKVTGKFVGELTPF